MRNSLFLLIATAFLCLFHRCFAADDKDSLFQQWTIFAGYSTGTTYYSGYHSFAIPKFRFGLGLSDGSRVIGRDITDSLAPKGFISPNEVKGVAVSSTSFQLGVRYQLSSAFSVQTAFSSFTASKAYDRTGITELLYLFDSSGKKAIAYIATEAEVVTKQTSLHSALSLFYRLPSFPLMIGAGVSLHSIQTFPMRLSQNIINPNNAGYVNDPGYTFYNANRSVLLSEGELPLQRKLHWGLHGTLQYQYNLTPAFSLTPLISYEFGIGSYSSSIDWNANTLSVGILAGYSF